MMKLVSRELPEEYEQQCHPADEACILRHEKIRLEVLCGSLLLMLMSFILFFTTGAILPLFITIVVVFLFYKWLDTTFERAEHPPQHSKRSVPRITRLPESRT